MEYTTSRDEVIERMGHGLTASPVSELNPAQLLGTVNQSMCSMDYEIIGQAASCTTHFSVTRLSHVDIFYCEGSGFRRSRRRFHHISVDHIDDFLIPVPLKTALELHHGKATIHIAPGSFVLLSTSRPFECCTVSSQAEVQFCCMMVRVPAPLLRQRIPHIDDCCNRPILFRPGAGRIMKSLLDLALSDACALPDEQIPEFSSALLGAIANAIGAAPEFEGACMDAQQSAHTRMFERALLYIQSNLSNNALDAELIARHCRVSKRYLRAAFASSATTVDTVIREQRLQRCRSALRSPTLSGRSIAQIASTWGFQDPAHFSRAYKARFGRTPRQDRGD